MDSIARAVGEFYNQFMMAIGAPSLISSDTAMVGYIIGLAIITYGIPAFFRDKESSDSDKEMSKITPSNANNNSSEIEPTPTVNILHESEVIEDIHEEKSNFALSTDNSENSNLTKKIFSGIILLAMLLLVLAMKNPSKNEFIQYLYSPSRIQAEAKSIAGDNGGYEAMMSILNLAKAIDKSQNDPSINQKNYILFSIFTVDLGLPDVEYNALLSQHYLGIFGTFFTINLNDSAKPNGNQSNNLPQSVNLQNDETSFAPEIEQLIAAWQESNEKCRGGLGNENSTWEQCELRDKQTEKLLSLGVCYEEIEQYDNEMKWHKCSGN